MRRPQHGRRLSATAGLVLALALVPHVHSIAATSDGRYSVRGAALVPCVVYVRERKAQSQAYRMIGSWIDGYISGINQQTPRLFDATSFESTELLAALVNEHCEKNPADSTFAVVKLLIDQIAANVIVEPSEKISVTQGKRSVLLYRETLLRLQKKMLSRGIYKGELNGRYDQATQEGIKLFQRSLGLTPTGFPDQLTLWRVFTDSKDSQPSKSSRRHGSGKAN